MAAGTGGDADGRLQPEAYCGRQTWSPTIHTSPTPPPKWRH